MVRESGEPPKVVATGPAAINQAMKAIAIARKYMLEEETGATDLDVSPQFEEDIRQSSRVCFVLGKARKTNPIVSHAPSEPIDELPRPLAVDLCATSSLSSASIPASPPPPASPPLSPPSPSSPPIHSKFTPFSSIGTHDPLALSTCPQPSETDLACKATTDPYKLAGAMAQRIRDGDKVACTTKGPVPVLIAVKAIAIANTYLADDGKQIKFTVSICDLENPEIHSDTVTSTYLHFALSAR